LNTETTGLAGSSPTVSAAGTRRAARSAESRSWIWLWEPSARHT